MAIRSASSATGGTDPVLDWLSRWARDTPDAPFLIAGRQTVDFGRAYERVSALAAGIRRSFPAGSRLGLVMEPVVETVLCSLAAPRAGMILVPLPVTVDDAERRRLAEIAGVHALLGSETNIIETSAAGIEPEADAVHSAVFTSGSGGLPRAVRLTWANIEASAAASAAHIDHTASDRWLAVLPLHHVGGLSILWRSVRQGSAVVLGGRFDARKVVELIHTGEVTLASFVSAMVEQLLDGGLDRGPNFRCGLIGGGPASERALSGSPLLLLPTYGMTETGSQIATADPAEPRPDRMVILEGASVSVSETGRVVVDGPMVSRGYLDEPDRVGPLVTSDLGVMHGNRLEVIGRSDSVIVTGGENVIPERVESAMARLPGAGAVAVVGLPDERWGALVAVAYTGGADPGEIELRLRSVLASFEVPRRWLRVSELPMIGVGKVDRAAVARLFD
jgi:o-succinylbenzoate---CoA ligase